MFGYVRLMREKNVRRHLGSIPLPQFWFRCVSVAQSRPWNGGEEGKMLPSGGAADPT